MNTISYLQFFDGLAEKKQGCFTMERISSKRSEPDMTGQLKTYRCGFFFSDQQYLSAGISRKEALRSLYRKMRKFGN